ncbi:NAD(P)H-dependent oxidoreductase [Paenibacillus antri]|uniref:NAD(P)H-dependent oxidoreductase n=1 Tax=Paenibacillus antri TaxID=2582848 RepID=A0A5R9G0P5_9BACL|nr:NAD(P)H-dependent oxidoreductase [Paenibacillus antri]TLS48569.1 NAD(P)H-dependent oxidoreductase [Paenibacillus antri]
MTNTLVIVAHPRLAEGSRINKKLVEAVASIEGVTVRDLYRTYPDERIDPEAEQRLLEAHERIVLQFPFWWYSSPHLLKKWTDEVLTYGWAYGPGGDKLRGKSLGLAVSTGGAESAFQAGGYNQYTMSELTRPFQATASLVGMTFRPIFSVHGSMLCDDETLSRRAAEYAAYVTAERETAIHA